MRWLGLEIKRFQEEELGASMLEYALLAACIAVVALAGVARLGTEARNTFNIVGTEVAGAIAPGNGGNTGFPPPGT